MEHLERWIDERVRGRRVAVVGVGNGLRADDGAGSRVAARLGSGDGWTVIDAGTVPENALGPLLAAAPDVVLFVDAIEHGAEPGDMCVLGAEALAGRSAGTHAPSLRMLAGLLRASGMECWMVGIQPRRFTVAAPMSPAVRVAADAVASTLAAARRRHAGRRAEPEPEPSHV